MARWTVTVTVTAEMEAGTAEEALVHAAGRITVPIRDRVFDREGGHVTGVQVQRLDDGE